MNIDTQKGPLDRFLNMQTIDYQQAVTELEAGQKKSHFMWHIFPQLRGLGHSSRSLMFGIGSVDEAREYLAHPVLGTRLVECCEAVLRHTDKTAEEIFGPTDAAKLRSSMTLFAAISEEPSVFRTVLDRFFDGECCTKTAELVANKEACHMENGVLVGYYGDREELIVPSGVIAVQAYAFYKRANLRRIVLPDTVIEIGTCAFAKCYDLESVTVPPHTHLGESAFGGCRHLADDAGFVVVNGTLSDYMGQDNAVTIPDGVIVIGASAFRRCRELEQIAIPSSVAVIDDRAFCGCFSLKQIHLSEYMAVIGRQVFVGCRNLRSITVDPDNETYHSRDNCLIETETKTLIAGGVTAVIPDDGSVTKIGEAAFSGQVYLTKLAIPDTIDTIGPLAFDACKSLRSLYLSANVRDIGRRAFARCPFVTIITPNGSTAANYAQEWDIPLVIQPS